MMSSSTANPCVGKNIHITEHDNFISIDGSGGSKEPYFCIQGLARSNELELIFRAGEGSDTSYVNVNKEDLPTLIIFLEKAYARLEKYEGKL